MIKTVILNLLGNALRTKRKEYKLTQEQAAELFEVSTRWYQKVEHGESTPDILFICQSAEVFNVDFALIYREAFLYNYSKIKNWQEL